MSRPNPSDNPCIIKQKRDSIDWITFGVGILTLVFLGIYTCTNYKLYQTTSAQFSIGDRAYVSIGDQKGVSLELRDVSGSDKPIVVAHFFNSGSSLARNFRATLSASSTSLKQEAVPVLHRHRFQLPPSEALPRGAVITTEGDQIFRTRAQVQAPGEAFSRFSWEKKPPKLENIEEADIPPKGDDLEYLTDNDRLLTRAKLSRPEERYTIEGDFEYCDIFGVYHCEKFVARYMPPPVNDFIQALRVQCVVEQVNPKDIDLPDGTLEIDSCEQPGEREYTEMKLIQ